MTAPTVPLTPDGPSSPPIDWASVLDEHGRWIRTVVLSRLGESQAVDEVMQEVALAAVAQRSPLIDPSRVGAWLYRLAIRQTLLYRRRSGRRHKLVDRYARRSRAEEADTAMPDPLGWLLADERRQLIREAMDRLPRRDAEILLLKYTQDWSYRELARRLGISESAVEARLHRVRRRLRDELARVNVIEASS